MKMEMEKRLSDLINWFIKNHKKTGFIVFGFLLVVTLLIIKQTYEISKENQRREMTSILNNTSKNINQILKNCYATTLTMAMTINDAGEPENFDAIASKLLASNNSIDVVQLVPNGVIKYIYPLKGNEAALYYNILTAPKHKKESRKTIQLSNMFFAGPIELKQGGMGILGRFPVFIRNKFWGFSAVIIKMEKFFDDAGITSLENKNYYFQFSKKNPDTKKEIFFLPRHEDFSNKTFDHIYFPDGDWNLYLITNNQLYLYYNLIPYSLLGLLLSFLIAFMVTTILKKPRELQLLSQTQATDLIQSEAKFKTIFDHAAIGIVHVDSQEDKFIEINDQYCQFIGYSEEEIRSKNLKSITYEEDLQADLDKMKELIDGKINKYTLEKRYIHKNGKILWGRKTVSPLFIKDQTNPTHIAIVEDITQKKEIQDDIKKNEARFKSLFEDSPIAFWEKDFSQVKIHLLSLGLFQKNKEEVTAFFKKNPEEIIKCIALVKIIDVNNECLILHKAKNKKQLIESFGKNFNICSLEAFTKHIVGITQNETKGSIESKITTFEGDVCDISLIWSVMSGYEDSLERVIVSKEDITNRKQSEKLIIESQQKIELLINTIDGIVWEFDIEKSKYTFISKKLENILGYTIEDWMSSPTFWADHIHPDDREFAVNYTNTQTLLEKQHDFEYRMYAKDGSIVWLKDFVNIIKENDGNLSQRGIIIDITNNKETEKDLNNSFDLVSEQNKRLLNFSYIVSHNLRSHTSNIQSLTNLILTADSDEEKNELVQLLKTVSHDLNETLLNLNDVVNIQTNMNLTVEPLNLKNYTEKTINVLSEQIQLKKAIIHNNLPDDVVVNYNAAYLESVLINFMSNAIRYAHPERCPVVKIEYFKEKNKTGITISDNGIGIDLKKNGDKIFGMYKTFSNNPDARGIGLFITKNQIDTMGGSVTVESEPNVGTTFTIYFK